MRLRLLPLILLCLTLGAAHAQDAPAPPGQQDRPQQGGGQRDGRGGGFGGGGFGLGRGTIGTVTAVAADHFVIKTELGESYTIHFSVNTRILKQAAGQRRGEGGQAGGQAGGQGGENRGQRTPPQAIKATDITVGDAIVAGGEVDAAAKSVGAVMIMLVDPERAKEMRALEANYGKTWLLGRVTAINEVRVTLEGGPDKAAHDFVADENTTFRKRREPITLADVKIGDMVRVEGAVKDGSFLATTVAVMGPPANGERGAENSPPPQ
ncbi:MAG TPA: DUF5666 domain-containing protein [Terracidiphilus sp.]|nr:DUF5666 domain-containing protein [Terracidiphilus sp.]